MLRLCRPSIAAFRVKQAQRLFSITAQNNTPNDDNQSNNFKDPLPPKRASLWSFLKRSILLKSTFENIFTRSGLVKDQDLASFLASTASVTCYTMAALTVAGTLGVDTSPLLAGVGVTGLTVGFALRDIASNYLSGVILLLGRQFRPGQLVTVGDPSKKLRGEYLRMDLRYTYLRTDRDGPDFDTIIMVPNQVVFSSDISVSTKR